MAMDIIPSDTRYMPLTQQKWCCTPTCFQIVMLRHDIPLIPAELIGYYMGLIVPEDGLKYFWNARTGERPPAGFGTQAGNKEYAPNAMFKKLNIPLKITWSLINKFKDIDQFKNYLVEVEKNNNDVLVCYDWGKLFDKPEYQGGHVCVLDRVYVDKDEVRIIDPEYDAPKWRMVKIDKLFEAMKFHGQDKSAGFWELHKV
jgi:hypothetical protein